ncbi:MAG TPA: lasso peptide biosynthesis B2 protein [Polyangiaceae bacterium]
MAGLVALRLALPQRLSREPLDELLRSLTPESGARRESVPASGKQDLLLIERGLSRLPGIVSTCLFRSLARYAVLRRLGVEAVFVMGILQEGLAHDGHAWIELAGQPFEEPADVSQYTVTFRYPPFPALQTE